ncbi:MAG TPA: hypothetical protein VD997_04000 [Phycisphaerales bacterium]|nr:hypothetical protein [Phycisphaerales bacterium]
MSTRTLAGAGVLFLLAGSTLAQTSPRYTVVHLGTGWNSTPTGLTNSGLVAGNYQNSSGQYRAFRWQEGGVQDLGTLGGTTQVGAVNEQGVMVGLSVNAQGRQRAVRIDASGITDLGGAANATASIANDINSAGWIVGSSMVPGGSSSVYRPLLWRDGAVLSLSTLPASPSGQADARALSDTGFVTGWAINAQNRQHAFRWTESGGMIDLGSLYAVGWSVGMDVNSEGTVVGATLTPDGQRGFVWTPGGGMQALGVPAGYIESWAYAINNAGVIVGYSTRLDDEDCITIFEPTLWQNDAARTPVALSQHVEGPAGGETLHSVLDINDHGHIVGITSGAGAVLLIPAGATGCTADFNGDGDTGTDQDIESFFACLGGNCCQTCPPTADFNQDGDVGTDQDIESFFRVLGGGAC